MCVIAVMAEEGKRPTEAQIERMWDHNDHGGGVAWREHGKVQWRKGLSLPEMQEMAQLMPFPHILHFRIASIGGKRPELTHPFVISDDPAATLELTGETDRGVVFHNGHWGPWNSELLAGSQRAGEEVPRGPWSDSRAMAWLYRYYGMGFLDTLGGQRTVVLTPDRLDFGIGEGWSKREGIWLSNTAWDYDISHTHYVCKQSGCYVSCNLDKDGYCTLHNSTALALQISSGKKPEATQAGSGGGQHGLPFDQKTQLVQAELAWSLVAAGVIEKAQARTVCSKNRLKHLRADATKTRMKAMSQSALVS